MICKRRPFKLPEKKKTEFQREMVKNMFKKVECYWSFEFLKGDRK